MTTNVSAKRQRELVNQLIEKSRRTSAEQQQIELDGAAAAELCQRRFKVRRQALQRTFHLDHDRLEADYQQRRAACREEYETQQGLVAAELEEKLNEAERLKTSAVNDGEYDWFLTKQRVQKDYEADRQAAVAEYQKRKAMLRHQKATFGQQIDATTAVLARHGCRLSVHGGDLLEEPADADHLAAHLQTAALIDDTVGRLRRTFWVRFVEERWFLIVFLATAVTAAFPLGLALGMRLVPTVVATTTIAVLAAAATRQAACKLAKQTAHQFSGQLAEAAASGKQQLRSARRLSRKKTEARLQRLTRERVERHAELDQQWQRTLDQINQQFTGRQDELQTWAGKRAAALEQQRTAAETQLADHFEPQLNRLREGLEQELLIVEREESSEREQLRTEHEERLQAAASAFSEIHVDAARQADEMRCACDAARIDFSDWKASQWSPPVEPVDAVCFGAVTVDLRQLTSESGDAQRPRETTEIRLPVALDLRHAPSLLIEAAESQRELATTVMRSVMLRILTGMPPGKVRFTVIDPLGLGRGFSAFMHLADHDEQLIGHRIWTEPAHIGQRLGELTQHIETVIQTYLRNEFATIQDYNQHAGEVAEPFHVLVVAGFPASCSEESAQRLLSIVASGPRCGVFTILSVDPQQAMPRNFDLADLHPHVSRLSVEQAEVRWLDGPLSLFPVRLDPLPTETQLSELLHAIGRQAKEASRVEVPFAAVAPPADQWWSGDSRNEICVPLGRAGATKFQSLRLGRGTSQHALISGKTGSGKSTLLHALITNLALHYSPNEVQFYLIDFKKGVEFKPYAQHRLPHARVIAIESEREFGMSVLQRLDGELRRRGDLFRRIGVQGLAGYRDARPDERMPRVLLVIDEFQEFFVKEDKISREASLLLDRLVRQGRAFGIHVLLGSQTLAGAYSLARATIGQMAVRMALQCSASDAHLILSDDNDAARLLRRPGEAIYNDANGMVEGNHPFQVVWLSDVEKDGYLRQLDERRQASGDSVDAPIVFEGNTAADAAGNELFRKAWESPAPTDIPLAPRAWVGEAIAIKEAPAAAFHRRSGSNLLLVGQQEEGALGVMAVSLLSLAAFSPLGAKRSRFVVLDGTRPEAGEAGYWHHLSEITGVALEIVKPRGAEQAVAELAAEVARRHELDDDESAATFLLIYNLARFRKLQKSEDDFGFGSFGERQAASPAEQLAAILSQGPPHGVHTLMWCDTHTNLLRWLDRQSLRDVEARVLFQMSATDSSNLMDSSAAAQLGVHRAILYSEDQGRAERFRPYRLPDDDDLLRVRGWLARRSSSLPRQRSAK